MSILEVVNFEGASGNIYSFIALAEDTEFNDVGAVYIFTKRHARNRYDFLYVGETESLESKIPSHDEWPWLSCLGVNSICIHRDDNKITRIMKKRDLLNKRNRSHIQAMLYQSPTKLIH